MNVVVTWNVGGRVRSVPEQAAALAEVEADAEVQTFARTRTGRLRAAFDERHDTAELLLITGITPECGREFVDELSLSC
jgi:hypothetical protein